MKVTFEHPDGARETHAANAGETVMDCALDHGVVGIKGQCGGACTCVTCHCYVAPEWFERLAVVHSDELEMLEYAPARRPNCLASTAGSTRCIRTAFSARGLSSRPAR